MAVYKKTEFKKFIDSLKYGSFRHWSDIAKHSGVEDNTIAAWRELPEAKEAIQEGIDQALAALEQAGRKDWRMWEYKLKLFGINPATKVEANVAVNAMDKIEADLTDFIEQEKKNARKAKTDSEVPPPEAS